jgi:hypothetical protein
MTPQVLSVPLSNGRRRAWRLDLVGCGEGKCGRKEACEAARGLEIADEMQGDRVHQHGLFSKCSISNRCIWPESYLPTWYPQLCREIDVDVVHMGPCVAVP